MDIKARKLREDHATACQQKNNHLSLNPLIAGRQAMKVKCQAQRFATNILIQEAPQRPQVMFSQRPRAPWPVATSTSRMTKMASMASRPFQVSALAVQPQFHCSIGCGSARRSLSYVSSRVDTSPARAWGRSEFRTGDSKGEYRWSFHSCQTVSYPNHYCWAQAEDCPWEYT